MFQQWSSKLQPAEYGYVPEMSPGAFDKGAYGTSGRVTIETLSENKTVQLFGKNIIIPQGTKVLIKKCANSMSLEGRETLNTQEWESIFQNKAANAMLAPPIYGYDNDKNIIVMGALEKTLKDKIEETKQFSISDQCQYLAIARGLDEIGIYHAEYKLDNFMFDENGTLYAIDFGLARPIDQVMMFNKGYSPNLRYCNGRINRGWWKNKSGGTPNLIKSVVDHVYKLAPLEKIEMDNKDLTEEELLLKDPNISKDKRHDALEIGGYRLQKLTSAQTKLKELGSVTDLIFEGINPILKGISIRKELSGIEL